MAHVTVTTILLDDESITRTKLNGLAGNLVSEFNGSIDNTNIKAAAGIVDSKLAQITTASKVSITALTDWVFWDNEIISWQNDLVYSN